MRSSILKSQSGRGVPPFGRDGSITHMRARVFCELKSVRIATVGLSHWIPLNRISVSTNVCGSPLNGAFSSDTRSRFGTALRGSPSSSACTIISVAGSSIRQKMLRMPGTVESRMLGCASIRGRSWTVRTTRPSSVQTSVFTGKFGMPT